MKLKLGLLAVGLVFLALPNAAMAESITVGVVGCSQTANAWRGWVESGDRRVWNLSADAGYSGGAVVDWAQDIPNGRFWQAFDANLDAYGPVDVIWWQLCERSRRNATDEQTVAVLAELMRRAPDATIFVSPLADFENPETCVKQDILHSRMLVQYLLNSRLVKRGPRLPGVPEEWILRPEGDGRCHIGEIGRAAYGEKLAGFDWGRFHR